MMSVKLIAASALAIAATCGVASAQGTLTSADGVWMLHTASKPGCPGLVLHLAKNGDGLKGFAASGDMAGLSRVNGTLDTTGKFKLTLVQVDKKGPKGTITGDRESSGWLVGQVTGSGCTDGPLKIPFYIAGPNQ